MIIIWGLGLLTSSEENWGYEELLLVGTFIRDESHNWLLPNLELPGAANCLPQTEAHLIAPLP